jgi:hypothetical protein
MTILNKKTRITASTLGVLLGLAGIFNHGIFEILQGNTPTNGYFIEAIGESHRYWIHGTEAAFTVIPNFLITGIFAVLLGLAVILWSIKYIQVKRGAIVFLLLLILLTLVGGGIGYILVFIPTWAFATRINKSLNRWKKMLPVRLRKILAALWIYSLAVTVISWLILMEMGIFGYFPGIKDPDTILNVVFGFLFTSAILVCFTFICAITRDIEEQNHH